jgi:hypothetical protein
MTHSEPIPFCDITYDVTNDDTSKLLSTGRKLVELEAAIAKHKPILAKALEERQRYIAGVLQQLS